MDITGIGSIADLAKTIINKVSPNKMSAEEKAKVEFELQGLLQKHEAELLEAQKEIMVAELQQQDDYTRRARPTIVYAGILFIFLVNVLFPIVSFLIKDKLPVLTLPEEFWWSWTSCCSVWFLGRSAEKLGNTGNVISTITGSKMKR
ncbi:MAG: holin family protein [Desulfobacterales bacterium]|nr:holin family protein [Desulfobacterales bacterium]